jgi:hypothetical protein
MIIKFVPGSIGIENTVPCPTPASKVIPNWYKDIPGGEVINVKKCMPFLDSLSHGYIQSTWCDIVVYSKNNEMVISQDDGIEMFKIRETTDLPIKDFYYEAELIWQRPWSPILPDGFSGLVTHPLNRVDLPFTTLSGVIDFDKSVHSPTGNIPFLIKKDFIGIIPKGTPMFQIIPIKRDSWTLEKQEFSIDFWRKQVSERFKIKSFYKKSIWQKKHFE